MDNFFSTNPVTNIFNGRIEDISFENVTAFVTISYADCSTCPVAQQTIRLFVNNNTRVLDENGRPVPISFLRVGMIVNASFSPATTRSNPPQAVAYMIRVVRRNISDSTTIGVITDIDRRNRSFITISNGNPVSVTQFNVPENVMIFDRFGRTINFSGLRQGMRVFVRHANFMTSSIPPQTTAFEVQVR